MTNLSVFSQGLEPDPKPVRLIGIKGGPPKRVLYLRKTVLRGLDKDDDLRKIGFLWLDLPSKRFLSS